LQKLDFSQLDSSALAIVFRTLLNLLKNLRFGTKSEVEDSLYEDLVDKFGALVQEERLF